MWRIILALLFVFALTGGCREQPAGTSEHGVAKPPISNPRIVGAMRNVMWKGERFARIDFDTLKPREHLFALGPLEDLTGEFIILDGQPYIARVVNNQIAIDSSFNIRAPFAGYAYIESWNEVAWPDTAHTLIQLEAFFDQRVDSKATPFFFRLRAVLDSATYHVMDLPPGNDPKTPDEVHAQGRVYFHTTNLAVELLGFYSTKHQGIFTHHSTHTHLHLLSNDRRHIGHLDYFILQRGSVKLLLPSNIALK